MNEPKTIFQFTDLKTWQESHKLVLLTYKIVSNLPKEERYGLSDQLRRAVVSITSNIAEGFSRQNQKEKIQFYYIALGSLTEVQNQLIIGRDLNYIKEEEYVVAIEQLNNSRKLLNGLIRSTKNL